MIKTFETFGLTSAQLGTLKITLTCQVSMPQIEDYTQYEAFSKTLQIVQNITKDQASTIFTRFKVLNRDIASNVYGSWTPNKIKTVRFY